MKIRLGYDISYDLPQATPMVLMLNVHASRMGDLLEADEIKTDPLLPLHYYYDGFGNRCARVMAPKGRLRLTGRTLIADSGKQETLPVDMPQIPVQELPDETLVYLQGSRYCETDRMGNLAWSLFGKTREGWPRVLAILEWVRGHIKFDYMQARSTKSAIDAYNERTGVCRDFQHLAITFCRCMNIPARYCTGYLGDIGVPMEETPMDFSAWFEVFLGGRWHTVDARHVEPRIGRVLMARGRDAADVPLSSSFGFHRLAGFMVVTDEVAEVPRRAVEPIRAIG
ncbi:transglutaminase-like domain-containing protein [Zavarzinia compransoris]|uniref:Transglutaminase n=1 Tax=Zavarzinia compransoris TaxID=1264899 RepID=A0A317EAN5_9PROT|nr:transglutaminase family protein [Zavarzinia compransoris]PWR23612.1 transglutaminase [Zavarzinia compransoris]TDP47830.1 transglutaminase-like putative cysteine protease [Zavarzinia compransoris]